MQMNTKQANAYLKLVSQEVGKTAKFIKAFNAFDKTSSDVACYDSMTKTAPVPVVPAPLEAILNSEVFADEKNKQAVFDGLRDGIAEYQLRNGGSMPSAENIYAALIMAKEADPTLRDRENAAYDSLTFAHHESLSIVPSSVQVVLSHAIANSLPLVAMLPNPTGSNEVPLVHGEITAGSNVGVMRKGELIDGVNAGMPYIDNIHTLVMTAGATAGEFSLTVHHAYNKEKRTNGSIKFVVDTAFQKAPFVAGRVSILVKGVEVANDKLVNHPVTTGISTLQSLGEVKLGADTYLVKSATADLDEHTITVAFDNTKTVPTGDEVEARIVYDYERKDNNGNKILTEPSTDMVFKPYSIYAYPVRALSSATIEAITQLQNELGISWYAAVQIIFINKFNFEQNARLLREAVTVCLNNQDHLITFDATKAGIEFNTMSEMFSNIKVTFGKGRTKLSKVTNTPVGAYDLYVSDKGAEFYEGMGSSEYTPTGVAFGDQGSIYQIGTTKNGSRVYYIPPSMGVFDEDSLTNGAYMMMIPRVGSPTKSPFVGTVSVPFMPRKSNKDAFEEDGGVFARVGAETNPIPRYSKQFVLIQLMNLPTL